VHLQNTKLNFMLFSISEMVYYTKKCLSREVHILNILHKICIYNVCI